MILSNIEIFFEKGTFLSNIGSNAINFVINNCDDSFGENIIMYYFYRKGYKISFLYDNQNKKITAEQIEIFNKKTGDDFLNSIITLNHFKNHLAMKIDEIYSDDDESIIFMKNGINVYFNNKFISKITSEDFPSRRFIMNFMKKENN